MLLLITYDVNTENEAGKKRLRKVAKQCQNYGRRVQNSVFECIVDQAQSVTLKSLLSAIMSELHILRFHRIFRMKCMQEREHLYRQTKVAINVADISILVKDRILDSFGQN